jgi:pimeloyl-ACP methyl ester carboxylesterase
MDMDGVRIHYTDQGRGPAVLLLHGSAESLRAWDGLVPRLVDRYRVLRMDLPNSGLSSGDPKDRYFVEDDCARISLLLDRLDIAETAIVGSSNGATIAFYCAVAHPEKVWALALTGVPGIRDTNAYFKLRVGQNAFHRWLAKYYERPSFVEASIRAVVANPAFLTPETVRQFQDLLNQKGRPAAWVKRLGYLKLAQTPARAQATLAQVSAPSLIVWGRNNPAYGPGCADDLEKIMVNARAVEKRVYDNVGHKVEREAPDRMADDLRAFFEKVRT